MNSHKIEIPIRLNAILYGLYYVEKIEKDESYKKLSDYVSRRLSEEERLEYKQALDWVVNNQDFDFNSTLPNLRKTNNEILIYLEKYRQFSNLF